MNGHSARLINFLETDLAKVKTEMDEEGFRYVHVLVAYKALFVSWSS